MKNLNNHGDHISMINKTIKGAASALVAAVLFLSGCGQQTEVSVSDIALEKDSFYNPIIRLSDDKGRLIYGGDPAVYVDGDTVYLYTGHDMSTDKEVEERAYHIPEYFCYSSKDLKTWTAEGVVMNMHDVEWAKDSKSAWASQVIKHYDEEAKKDLYYLYFCSWDKTSRGKQSIGVAVSESPTGPFTDIGEPIVRGIVTKPETSAWNDIDPTVWVDTDENGNEKRYLAWGNGKFFICELNPDMISVKDQNDDGKITSGRNLDAGDILTTLKGFTSYTEAPWLYRRQDSEGNYYGDYYLFYASEWRESLAYSTASDPMADQWTAGNIFMKPTATCNTNHEAIFDFNGKTYMMYHDGARPGGNGYRRSACLQELVFEEDGSISLMEESTAGLFGSTSLIKSSSGSYISHEQFTNSSDDSSYPYLDIKIGEELSGSDLDRLWVITDGKYDPDNEYLASIQAENKTGLYITAGPEGSITLSQDVDGSEDTAKKQTFKTTTSLNGKDGMVSLESTFYEGMYLTVSNGILTLSDGSDADASTFVIE
ncbi:MAG: glycosyl hydrolase family 43 [Butyrivibrio sp.]|nr:glycosyl hydrolase family 43 [Butyrivibrio sp.]